MHADDAAQEPGWIDRAQGGDRQAMEALIEMHLPLISLLASRIQASCVERETLIQAGCIGMMQAVRHYARGREAKLTTYAVSWILGEMKRAIQREASFCLSLNSESDEDERTLLDTLCAGSGIDIDTMDLRMAIERLEEDLRLVICLRYFRDKTQKETALLLHRSQAQISRMERQALDALYAQLA